MFTELGTSIFDSFRELVYKNSGIKLDDSKEPLIRARVGKRMRALGISDHKEYLKRVIQDESGQEIVHLLDAISTNVTSFFRGADHFQFLKNAAKEWQYLGQKRVRIWSSACSSGEEPYSIAMTILEAIGGSACDVKILATDISTRMLEKAQAGIYDPDKIKHVPKELRDKYFEMFEESGEILYKAKTLLKDMIVFRRLNLSSPPFPMRGPMDMIFCRNVMIYFDNNIRQRLLKEIYRLLRPYGYLMVGHAESLIGFTEGFKLVRPSIYVKEE